MSKFFAYLAFIQVLFASIAIAHNGYGQKLEQTRIFCDWKNVSLEKAFVDIQTQTDLFFTYTYETIDNISISSKNSDLTVADMLAYLSSETGLRFKFTEDIVYVFEGAHTLGKRKHVQVPSNEALAAVIKTLDYDLIFEIQPTYRNFNRIIKGKVVADNGEPLIGASVVVKESGQGAITDLDGSFSIVIPENAASATLIISYVGFDTKEVVVTAESTVTIVLTAAKNSLDELVVIGYGKQSKAKVTGALSRQSAEQLDKYNAANFEQQLSGKVAGLQINEFGLPGTDAQIVIRGIGTLTAGNKPLIVVDGFPLTEGSSLTSINPKDIESIDILKDAASAAIYGSRAANGVILIKTKEGIAGKPQLSFDIFTGFQIADMKYEFVDAYEAAQFFTEARDWGYVSKNPATRSVTDDAATRLSKGANKRELRLNYLDPYLAGQTGLANTNWLDEVFRVAPMTNYNLSVAGGSEKTKYYISGSYFTQQGISIGADLKRYNLAFKANTELAPWLDFGISLNPSISNRNYFNNNGDWSTDPLGAVSIMYPFFKSRDDNGNLIISEQIIANTPEDGALAENVVAMLEYIKNKQNNYRVFGHSFFKFKLLKGLDFTSTLGGDYRSTFNDYFNPSFVGQYRTKAPKPAVAIETSGFNRNFQIENLLTFDRNFGNNSVNIIAGYTFQKEEGAQTTITGSGIADDNITNIALQRPQTTAVAIGLYCGMPMSC